SLHPYELPEVIALPVTAAHPPYLDWLADSVKKERRAPLPGPADGGDERLDVAEDLVGGFEGAQGAGAADDAQPGARDRGGDALGPLRRRGGVLVAAQHQRRAADAADRGQDGRAIEDRAHRVVDLRRVVLAHARDELPRELGTLAARRRAEH